MDRTMLRLEKLQEIRNHVGFTKFVDALRTVTDQLENQELSKLLERILRTKGEYDIVKELLDHNYFKEQIEDILDYYRE